MKTFSRKISLFLIVCIIASIFMVFPSAAASGTMSISVSSQTVSVGDTFTVTVNYSGDVQIANAEWCLNYDTNLVSYEGKSGKIPSRYDSTSLEGSEKSFSQVYTFQAIAVGSANFTVSDYRAIPIMPEDGDSVSISVNSVSLNIVAKGSNNANLSTLKISSGTLTPSFSNDITAYTVNVPYSVSSLSISASASDSKAKVSLSGSDALTVGENTRVIIVTAEDGTVKKFTITINRAQSVQITASPTPPSTGSDPTPVPTPTAAPPEQDNVLEVTVGGAILTISQRPESITLPDNFEETTYTYKEKEVWAAKSKVKDIILFYMVDDGNEKSGYYVYDAGSDSFYRFVSIYVNNDAYSILQPSVSAILPSGFYEKTARINGADLTVWVPEADRYSDVEDCRYLLVYAMRRDGVTGFYLYDTVETAFLKYSEDFVTLFGSSAETTPRPNVTPVPGSTGVLAGDDTEQLSLWGECKAYFGRIFGSGATAVDWLITVFLILFIVLIMVLVVFIVYAVKKRKEEEEDGVPLNIPDADRNFRKMVSLEEYEEEEQEPESDVADETILPETEPDESAEPFVEPVPSEEKAKSEENLLDFTIGDFEEETMLFEDMDQEPQAEEEEADMWQPDGSMLDGFLDEDDKKE